MTGWDEELLGGKGDAVDESYEPSFNVQQTKISDKVIVNDFTSRERST